MLVTEMDILNELRDVSDKVPQGWYRRRHFEKQWNLGESQTCRYLRKAIDQGKIEKRDFIINGNKTPHYRICEKKSQK